MIEKILWRVGYYNYLDFPENTDFYCGCMACLLEEQTPQRITKINDSYIRVLPDGDIIPTIGHVDKIYCFPIH